MKREKSDRKKKKNEIEIEWYRFLVIRQHKWIFDSDSLLQTTISFFLVFLLCRRFLRIGNLIKKAFPVEIEEIRREH